MTSGPQFTFAPYTLDATRRRLMARGEPLAISDRQLDVLLLLVARAGQIVGKDDLLEAAWKDVAVGDNSIEQAISSLRRLLAEHPDGAACIETVARRGYRFTAAVTRTTSRETDAGLDALLAPHRAFIEGRAALESLERDQVARAREVFEDALRATPEYASAHVGLANACAMQFEMTRADLTPDVAALELSVLHAREACRLDPRAGEAWATLAFVLDRTGNSTDARAAARRAVSLEADNWRHHFRLAYVSWGEERLSAARRTLALLPGFPLAHWLAATVHVARQVLSEAERELTAGLAAERETTTSSTRFAAVALHWLLGLIHLANGDEAAAIDEFERELLNEHSGQLYARECAANTWYAIGAIRLRQGRRPEASAAFTEALSRIGTHSLALLGLEIASASGNASPSGGLEPSTHLRARPFDAAFFQATALALGGDRIGAAQLIDAALAAAPPGNAGWTLPVEPLLQVSTHPDDWSRALTHLRNRAL